MSVGIGTLWRFFQRHRITLKERLRSELVDRGIRVNTLSPGVPHREHRT
jgi:hypothetical protein